MFQYNESVGVRVGHVDQLHVSPLAVSCCDVCFERDPSFVVQRFMLYSLFIFISLNKLVSNTIYISNYVRVVQQQHNGCQYWGRNCYRFPCICVDSNVFGVGGGSCCSIFSFLCSLLQMGNCLYVVLFPFSIVFYVLLRFTASDFHFRINFFQQ